MNKNLSLDWIGTLIYAETNSELQDHTRSGSYMYEPRS